MKYKRTVLSCESCPYAAVEIEKRKLFLGEEDYQPEFCWCDKVGGKMAYCGFCGESFYYIEKQDCYRGHKNTGYSFRKSMGEKKLFGRLKLYGYVYRGSLGTYENGHIKLPRNSKRQRFYKNQTSRRIRRYKGKIPNGCAYRRFLDYWWNVD